MSKTICYRRVSTDEQANSGLGMEAQRTAILEACKRLDLPDPPESLWFADEGVSGSVGIDKRPGLLGAIQSIGKGDTLVVAKRDRLGRDSFLMAWLDKEAKRKKARIVSAAGEGTEDDDPGSVVMRRIVDAFAEYERAMIGVRTKAALGALRARGKRFSRRAPFGYEYTAGGDMVANETEQEVAEAALSLREEGASYKKIADLLNGEGLKNRDGNPIAPKVVRDICLAAGVSKPVA